MKYQVLIPTSGVGARLGEETAFLNKALVRVGDKPAISHIIENYPENVEFVVTLGYLGHLVRDFLTIAYPDRKIRFVEVDKYEGLGSSLIYSLLKAKDVINSPFIMHACDTLLPSQEISEPSFNWLGGYRSGRSSDYTSFDVSSGNVVSDIYDKGQTNFDYAFIGVSGVFDYKDFFVEAEKIYNENPWNIQLSNIDVFKRQIQKGIIYAGVDFSEWLDIGNVDSLKEAREYYSVMATIHVLNKPGQAIYLIGDRIIKFFHDVKMVSKRVDRAKALAGLVPEIDKTAPNFFSYRYVSGVNFDAVVDEKNFESLLEYAKVNLWQERRTTPEFQNLCKDFYITKTKKRLYDYLWKYNISDSDSEINGFVVPSVDVLLCSIRPEWVIPEHATNYHGDFILDNIIRTEKRFSFVDWRQDFGGDLENGDMYYDLAKLNFSLVFNQRLIDQGLYTVEDRNVDLLISYKLSKCKDILASFVKRHKLDINRILLLTAMIWLNMAPLHDAPLDKFLFLMGKLELYKVLTQRYFLEMKA